MTETVYALDPAPAGTVFGVDLESRTIRGRAVPYGVEGVKNGRRFQFSRGTVRPREGMRVKLWGLHDQTQAFGVVTEWTDSDEGLDVAFKVARGAEGDRALSMADDGVWDGLSIGPSEGAKYRIEDGIYHAVDIPIHEISLTPAPVFTGARVSSVAFDTTHQESSMTDTATETVEAPGVDFSALTTGLTEAIVQGLTSGFASLDLAAPQGERETVSAGGRVEVTEALPYRFDGMAGAHSFSADLRSMASGDTEAKQRLDTFMDEAFAVTPGNVTALNPTINRPELYVPNLEFTRPLWGLVSTGVVEDVTPFTIPKFSSAAGLVGPHTSGVEPTPGSFTATNQTITPAPVSGKVEILREVWDQGGNPKADAIIWREMVNGYYEAIEAKIAAMLNALALTEINLASATNAALVTAVQNIFVDLQFVRGGNRYSALALDGMLFKALVAAQDTSGRNLLPVLAPANADGTVGADFSVLAIGSQKGVAAWPLGATNASNSYLFVPGSVWAWASAPKRFTFEYQVKSVDMAVWGYTASAVLRDTDVKRIDYTTADV